MNSSKKNLLQWYQELGADYFINETPQDRSKIQQKSVKKEFKENVNLNSSNIKDIARNFADKCTTIEELRDIVEKFDKLDIKKYAINTVFGDGNSKSDIMLIGEAPGANEDKHGIPFCGQSGKLLDNILAAIKIDRTSCYITNTIFWRPPANRRPTSSEIDVCRPFVEKHVALVNPKIIILVGSTAVESLLGLKTPMGQLRNKTFKYTNSYLKDPIDTFVIFHPSYLLRQPSQKKTMWLDIQKIYNFYKDI
ncbi:MAG: uracil-DNA glycosylase family protein [Candidatus Midichloriaceae bacterium]